MVIDPIPASQASIIPIKFPILSRPAPGRTIPEILAKQGARLDLSCQGRRRRRCAVETLDSSSPAWPDPGMVFRAGFGPAMA